MQLPNPQPIQPLPVQGVQQPVVFYQMPAPNNRGGPLENYQAKQSKFLGAFQILIGVFCIFFNGISIGISNSYGISIIGYGVWNGALFIVTGVLGLVAGRNKSKFSIIAFMVLCIISASFTTVLLSLGISGASGTTGRASYYERHNCRSDNSYYSGYYGYSGNDNGLMPRYYTTPPPCTVYKVVIAMEALMAVMAVLEAILAIWGSAICCKAVCCCSSTRCTNGIMLIPQYCCSDQQMISLHPEQAPFQQVPYYVFPTPGSDANGQFVSGQPMPISTDVSAGGTWNPPPYTSQAQPPVYPLPEETKHGALC